MSTNDKWQGIHQCQNKTVTEQRAQLCFLLFCSPFCSAAASSFPKQKQKNVFKNILKVKSLEERRGNSERCGVA